MYYTLDDDHNPVKVDNIEQWVEQFDSTERIVKQEKIEGISISTVFLGLDHNFGLSKNSDPVLFETMIFGGKHDQQQWRYCTWDEALEGHHQAVKKVTWAIDFIEAIKNSELDAPADTHSD